MGYHLSADSFVAKPGWKKKMTDNLLFNDGEISIKLDLKA